MMVLRGFEPPSLLSLVRSVIPLDHKTLVHCIPFDSFLDSIRAAAYAVVRVQLMTYVSQYLISRVLRSGVEKSDVGSVQPRPYPRKHFFSPEDS